VLLLRYFADHICSSPLLIFEECHRAIGKMAAAGWE
jgi:hypothetical protein